MQVVYVFFVGFMLVSLAISLQYWVPTLNKFDSRYQLACSNGSYWGNFEGSSIDFFIANDFYSNAVREFARYACNNTELSGAELRDNYYAATDKFEQNGYTSVEERAAIMAPLAIPTVKNYKIEILQEKYYGSWWEFTLWGIISLLAIILIASLVRAVFLYVAFKESFIRTIFFLKSKKKN